MKRVETGNVWIYPRYATKDGLLIDVFTGNGYSKYTCFKVTGKKLKFIRGVDLSPEDFQKLKSLI